MTLKDKQDLIDVLARNGLELMAHKLDDKAIIIALQLLQLEELKKIGKMMK